MARDGRLDDRKSRRRGSGVLSQTLNDLLVLHFDSECSLVELGSYLEVLVKHLASVLCLPVLVAQTLQFLDVLNDGVAVSSFFLLERLDLALQLFVRLDQGNLLAL